MISSFIPLLVSPVAENQKPHVQSIPSAFTWQTFNKNMNVTTFVAPDGSRDQLWHFLNSAEESIFVEIYGVNNPYILDLIRDIHTTKPGVDIKILIGWHSLGYLAPYEPNPYVAYNLTLMGVDFKWTSDTEFTYAHQKFVVIDNKTTIIQAGNWAKTSFPEDGKKSNREWNIAMTDTDVADYYLSVFDYDWGNGIAYDQPRDGTGLPLSYDQDSSTYPRPFAEPGHFSGQMSVTPIVSPETSLQGILYCINSAQVTLDIQIPYFTSVGDAGSVDQIIDAILAAKARDVTVRIITQDEKDYVEAAEIFTNAGIPMIYQDTRWAYPLHNKGIIVDGRIVLISSINYSDGSIEDNREAGVIIEHEAIAQWYSEVFDFDWGLGDFDEIGSLNVYWNPNIPTLSSEINVTVYAHELRALGITDVSLGVKIDSGSWSNYTITSTVFDSAEGDPENYFYVISPQSDGTNITVQATVIAGGDTYVGMEMVIRVRDSIGSITTPTPTPTPTGNPLVELLIELLPYIALAVVVLIGAICVKKRK